MFVVLFKYNQANVCEMFTVLYACTLPAGQAILHSCCSNSHFLAYYSKTTHVTWRNGCARKGGLQVLLGLQCSQPSIGYTASPVTGHWL